MSEVKGYPAICSFWLEEGVELKSSKYFNEPLHNLFIHFSLSLSLCRRKEEIYEALTKQSMEADDAPEVNINIFCMYAIFHSPIYVLH